MDTRNISNQNKSISSVLKNVFTALKNFIVNFADDAVDLLRSSVPGIGKFTSAIVSGGFTAYVLFMEAYKAFKELKTELEKKELENKKTFWDNIKLITLSSCLALGVGGGIISVLSVIGGIMKTSYLGALPLAINPLVISVALVSIYGLTVYRLHHEYSKAKKEEWDAKSQMEMNEKLPDTSKEKIDSKHQYFEAKKCRLAAQRELFFGLFEAGGSLVIATGVAILAMIAFSAASAATFGALPLALIVTGVVIGAASKIVEMVDEQKDFALTNRLFDQDLENTKLIKRTTTKKTLSPSPSASSVRSVSQSLNLSPSSSLSKSIDAKDNLESNNSNVKPPEPSVQPVIAPHSVCMYRL